MIRAIRSAVVVLCAIFLVSVIFCGAAVCKDKTGLISVKGEPKIMKQGNSTWDTCKLNSAVDNGDRIRTLKGEAVEIYLSGDSAKIVKVEEDSDVYIRKCRSPYSIELLSGSAMAYLEKLPKGSTFEIRTPTGISGARGTGWGVRAGELKAVFKAFENVIYVKGIDADGNEIPGELVVKEGWQSIVDKFQKPGALEELAAGDFEKWLEWKKDLMERLEELKRLGFEGAEGMENRIQELEDKKNADVRDARDSDAVGQRQDSSGGSGGRQDEY
ncbi:MAG: FecR family protein [Candidatus Omnitrophota bacterium]